eukprot:1151268-Pelagomonas_calceolata.AAC.6
MPLLGAWSCKCVLSCSFSDVHMRGSQARHHHFHTTQHTRNTHIHTHFPCPLQPTSDRQLAQEESYFMEGDSGQARMQIRVQAPVQVEIPEGSTLEQSKLPNPSSLPSLAGEAALGGRRAAAAAASQAPVDGRTGGFARPGCATRHQITGEAGGGAERGPAAATGGAAVCGAWGRAVQGVRALVVRAASSMAACAESLDFRGKLSFQHRMSVLVPHSLSVSNWERKRSGEVEPAASADGAAV